MKKHFGYKSVLVRNQINSYVMEVYQPILLNKGLQNLQKKEESLRIPKNEEDFKESKKF